jgi:type IV secretion system protein VirB2
LNNPIGAALRLSCSVGASYDAYGRLLTYNHTGDPSQSNAYNGLDERVSATNGSTTRSFVYDPDGRLIGEYHSTGSPVAVAVIAVACFGLMLLSGRLPKRRGTQLILGCFSIFGASSIAAGMMAVPSPTNTAEPPIELAVIQPTPATPQPVAARNYDPYAGAALPPRR